MQDLVGSDTFRLNKYLPLSTYIIPKVYICFKHLVTQHLAARDFFRTFLPPFEYLALSEFIKTLGSTFRALFKFFLSPFPDLAVNLLAVIMLSCMLSHCNSNNCIQSTLPRGSFSEHELCCSVLHLLCKQWMEVYVNPQI